MKIRPRSGWLYLEFWDKEKKITVRRSLSLRDTSLNKRHAQALLKELKENKSLLANLLYREPLPDIKTAMEEYTGYYNLAPNTVALYRLAVNHFIKACGCRSIDQYTEEDYISLKKYFDTARVIIKKNGSGKDASVRLPLSTNSRSIYTRHLHTLFEYYVAKKNLKKNIIVPIKAVEGSPEIIPRYILKKLLAHLRTANKNLYCIINFISQTGIRISTALNLCWEDIDWRREEIILRNIKVRGRRFAFPLTASLKNLLLEIDGSRVGNIFSYKDRNSVNRLLKKAFREIGSEEYHLHQLKHTFVSELVDLGISLEDISVLTNTSLKTLKKHYWKENHRRIALRLNEAMKKW